MPEQVHEKITELEVVNAAVQQQLISIREDNKRLLESMEKLNQTVNTIQNDFSRGKGMIIGVTCVLGAAFTVVNQYLGR